MEHAPFYRGEAWSSEHRSDGLRAPITVTRGKPMGSVSVETIHSCFELFIPVAIDSATTS